MWVGIHTVGFEIRRLQHIFMALVALSLGTTNSQSSGDDFPLSPTDFSGYESSQNFKMLTNTARSYSECCVLV